MTILYGILGLRKCSRKDKIVRSSDLIGERIVQSTRQQRSLLVGSGWSFSEASKPSGSNPLKSRQNTGDQQQVTWVGRESSSQVGTLWTADESQRGLYKDQQQVDTLQFTGKPCRELQRVQVRLNGKLWTAGKP